MQQKLRFLFWIGIFLLCIPFFGVPGTWKTIGIIIAGAVVILLSFSFRRNYKELRNKLRRLEQPVVDQSIHTDHA